MTSEQTLRTGVLFKKGSGTGPFGRRNWKPRYFVLTPRKLSYYTYEDGDLKGEVDLSGCNEQSIEVMPADSMKTGSSASTIWRIAINAADRRLIVAAGTELEMNDWVEQLLVAFHINSGQPLPQRRSVMHAPPSVPAHGPGSHAHADQDVARNTITDFQNFAVARRSVGGAVRASIGAHSGHEFRLSDEHERQKQAEQHRLDEKRQLAEMEAERLREEELLQAHLRSQAEERRKQKEVAAHMHQQEEEEKQHEVEDIKRKEDVLEEQRRLKREQHERERLEAERIMREKELQEQQKQREEQALEEQRRLKREQHERERLEAERVLREKELQEQQKQREEELLEEQRRLKREQHERERLEAERMMREMELKEQQKKQEVQEVQVHRQVQEIHRVVEVHRREVVEHIPSSPVRSPIVTPPSAPSPPQRSSLIGDAKKEAMMRQQAEHNKRREAAIKEQQEQMRQEYLSQGARSPPRSPTRPQVEVHRPTTPVKGMSSVEF